VSARASAWLVGVALLAGCVTVPEFRSLEHEVAEMKRGGQGSAPDSRLADLGSEVDQLREEVAQLRGELEEAKHVADRALTEAEAARDAVARAPSPTTLEPEDAGLSAEVKAYEEAFRLYRSGDYEVAIDRFRAFLQNHPSSDYADNAMFWLAECHFKLGDYEQAVLAFDDVVKRYPEGNKVPDALYRQGIALIEIGNKTGQQKTHDAAARQIFQRLVNDYPDSDRVPEARRQLEKLGT
jgi:tol-pal system protein YbgF